MSQVEQMTLQQIIEAGQQPAAIDWLENRAGTAAPSVTLDFTPTLSLQQLWERGHEGEIINYLGSDMPIPSTPGAHSGAFYATPDAKHAQYLLNVAIDKDTNNTAAAALRHGVLANRQHCYCRLRCSRAQQLDRILHGWYGSVG